MLNPKKYFLIKKHVKLKFKHISLKIYNKIASNSPPMEIL